MVRANHLLGCDGAFSAARRELLRHEPIDFAQHYVSHGYKELAILPDAAGAARLPTHCLHIWPRERFMLIALPNQVGARGGRRADTGG